MSRRLLDWNAEELEASNKNNGRSNLIRKEKILKD